MDEEKQSLFESVGFHEQRLDGTFEHGNQKVDAVVYLLGLSQADTQSESNKQKLANWRDIGISEAEVFDVAFSVSIFLIQETQEVIHILSLGYHS